MTLIAHGKIAPVLADGSSLLKSLTLTPEQSSLIQHDIRVLKASERSRKVLGFSNIAVRASTVLLLVLVGAMVITESIPNLVAFAIVLPLLFAVDIFNVISKKVTARNDARNKTLKMLSTVLSMANGQLFSKTQAQKLESYHALLTTGNLILSKASMHRLVLADGKGQPQTLRYLFG